MKQAHVYFLLLVLASDYATLAHAVDVAKSEEDVVTVAFKNNDLAFVSKALTKAFHVRVCSEDYGVVNPDSKTVIPGDFESGGPIAKGSEYRFSGEFTASTVDEMLDALTGSSPYAWQAINDCYVIYPRKGSLLMSEKVTLEIAPCSLWDAVCAIINARSEKNKADQDAGVMDFRQGIPRLGSKDVFVSGRAFKDTLIAEALCRAVEAVTEDPPGFLAIWTLGGGWARECRWTRVYLIETRDDALVMPLPW